MMQFQICLLKVMRVGNFMKTASVAMVLLFTTPYTSYAQMGDVTILAPSGIPAPYDPFSGIATAEQSEIELVYTGEGNREVLLDISPDFDAPWALLGEGGIIDFDLTSTDLPGAVVLNERFEASLTLEGNATPKSINLDFFIPELQYADAGMYLIELVIVARDPVTREPLSAERRFRVESTVVPRAQTNIAGAASSFDAGVNFAVIDFGEPETGETERVIIQVRANAETLIQLTSDNQGKLANQESEGFFIPYSVVVDGVSSNLEAPLEITRRPPRNLAGAAYPMDVILGDVTGAASGRYEDMIHIDVFPQ